MNRDASTLPGRLSADPDRRGLRDDDPACRCHSSAGETGPTCTAPTTRLTSSRPTSRRNQRSWCRTISLIPSSLTRWNNISGVGATVECAVRRVRDGRSVTQDGPIDKGVAGLQDHTSHYSQARWRARFAGFGESTGRLISRRSGSRSRKEKPSNRSWIKSFGHSIKGVSTNILPRRLSRYIFAKGKLVCFFNSTRQRVESIDNDLPTASCPGRTVLASRPSEVGPLT